MPNDDMQFHLRTRSYKLNELQNQIALTHIQRSPGTICVSLLHPDTTAGKQYK